MGILYKYDQGEPCSFVESTIAGLSCVLCAEPVRDEEGRTSNGSFWSTGFFVCSKCIPRFAANLLGENLAVEMVNSPQFWEKDPHHHRTMLDTVGKRAYETAVLHSQKLHRVVVEELTAVEWGDMSSEEATIGDEQ